MSLHVVEPLDQCPTDFTGGVDMLGIEVDLQPLPGGEDVRALLAVPLLLTVSVPDVLLHVIFVIHHRYGHLVVLQYVSEQLKGMTGGK